MDKISKSFADFKNAVVSKDISMLTGVFGFTKKTAEKLISSLKDKISNIAVNDLCKMGGCFSKFDSRRSNSRAYSFGL
jgi:Holliday junction DNA helicase RuvA